VCQSRANCPSPLLGACDSLVGGQSHELSCLTTPRVGGCSESVAPNLSRKGPIANRQKRGHVFRRHGIGSRHGVIGSDRIHEDAIPRKPVIEMGTCGEAARSHTPNELALPHARAGRDRYGRQVQVLSLESIRVAQVDAAPGISGRAGLHHHTIGNRHHQGALRRPIIDPKVRAILLQDRMKPAA